MTTKTKPLKAARTGAAQTAGTAQPDALKTLAAKLPPALLRQIDRSAKKAGRNRSQEVRIRLQHSLQSHPQLASLS
jgi:hypothetical protein